MPVKGLCCYVRGRNPLAAVYISALLDPELARSLTSVRSRSSDRACFGLSKPQAFITESGTNCVQGKQMTCVTL